MKCGFCSFFCPVYQEERTETSVARGKNYLDEAHPQRRAGVHARDGRDPRQVPPLQAVRRQLPLEDADRQGGGGRARPDGEGEGPRFHQELHLPQGHGEQEGHGALRETHADLPVAHAENGRQGPPPAGLHQIPGRQELPRACEDVPPGPGKAGLPGRRPAEDDGRLLYGMRHRFRLSRARPRPHHVPHPPRRRGEGAARPELLRGRHPLFRRLRDSALPRRRERQGPQGRRLHRHRLRHVQLHAERLPEVPGRQRGAGEEVRGIGIEGQGRRRSSLSTS